MAEKITGAVDDSDDQNLIAFDAIEHQVIRKSQDRPSPDIGYLRIIWIVLRPTRVGWPWIKRYVSYAAS